MRLSGEHGECEVPVIVGGITTANRRMRSPGRCGDDSTADGSGSLQANSERGSLDWASAYLSMAVERPPKAAGGGPRWLPVRRPRSSFVVRRVAPEVASTVLPDGLDDGLAFDPGSVTAEAIREEEHAGVRVHLLALLASAREPFHVDVSIGDPIWPAPAEISLQRGPASTR